MTPGRPVAYRFGSFTLESASYRLLKRHTVVPVSPKVIDLLLYLVARPSVLVSKEDLFRALWPDVAVTDNALTQAVSELRQALGDDPSSPKFVQTVARRGYRFIAPVENVEAAMAAMADGAVAAAARPSAVGVLDFANVSGDPSLAWLSSGIAETVTNDLRSAAQLRIIDRTRIVEAARRGSHDPAALRRELGLDLAVVGSFQRVGDRLRVTARVIDASTGEALADGKADGALVDVFDLQDRIVAQLSDALGRRGDGSPRRPYRETSSLEAYQAFTEARVRLETLESREVGRALDGFQRAIELDSRYAAAYVGLANAYFWQYEMSRARNKPDGALLAMAIDHVRRAIELERDLAEAHATLAFLLVSAGRAAEALGAARRAVSLEPGYWGHHFRVGHAAWGDERLRALSKVMELYPDFPFAHFEAAMVHIARGAPDRAESLLREGTLVQDRQAHLRQRFPARGLHWLLGLVRLAQGDLREAESEFDKERAGGTTQLYASEFVMNACDGAGFARLAAGRGAEAVNYFDQALALYPEHARSLVGLGSAFQSAGQPTKAGDAFTRAGAAIEALRRGGRGSEATLAQAFLNTAQGQLDEAVASLRMLVERPDVPFAGWTIPIEPLLAPLRHDTDFVQVLSTLADRAR
jgi:DNA-binding winged helix-turn-helix (wHTH) protein/tetratricopeptide (TPR) repeat protein